MPRELSNIEIINQLLEAVDHPKDSTGAPLQRPAIAKPGRKYQKRNFNFTTSTFSSLSNKKLDHTDYGDMSIKFYNSSGTEITTQGTADTDCTLTVVRFELAVTYEVIGGQLRWLVALPGSNDDAWILDVVGAPGIADIPFVTNEKLKFYSEKIYEIYGYSAKELTYISAYPTANQLYFKFYHPAGAKLEMQGALHIFLD